MQVYSLLGCQDYDGVDLLGVFASVEQLLQFVDAGTGREEYDGAWCYDRMGYVQSELGSSIDVRVEFVDVEFRDSGFYA
jgi:hypothetical protein